MEIHVIKRYLTCKPFDFFIKITKGRATGISQRCVAYNTEYRVSMTGVVEGGIKAKTAPVVRGPQTAATAIERDCHRVGGSQAALRLSFLIKA